MKIHTLNTAKLLVVCSFLIHFTISDAKPGHDHDHEPTNPIGGRKAPNASDEPGFNEGRCQVSSRRLADFANGDGYDFGNLVNYLTVPSCQAASRDIGRAAIAAGINFKAQGPYRLDAIGRSLSAADLESSRNAELALAKTIPQLLRTEPIGSTDLLPILGQLSVLSPQAARSALSYMIQSELQNGDDRWQIAPPDLRPQIAVDISQTLLKLGANRAMISNDLAVAVGEMVMMEQTESLSKYFRAMALAAALEDSLIPTFNLSASSFYRSVERTSSLASAEGRAALLKSAFIAAQSALDGPSGLEVGAREFNESLEKLLAGRPLTQTALKKLWKAVMVILAKNPNQTALAASIALSVTPQMVFLQGKDRDDLIKAASHYPFLSQTLQQRFLEALEEMWGRMSDRRISVAAFNRMREKYLSPMVSEILQFDPDFVDNGWLKEVVQRGLVNESEIERRFPRLMLAQLKRAEKAASVDDTANSARVVEARAENMAVLLALTQVHVPTLDRWVNRQEKQ